MEREPELGLVWAVETKGSDSCFSEGISVLAPTLIPIKVVILIAFISHIC